MSYEFKTAIKQWYIQTFWSLSFHAAPGALRYLFLKDFVCCLSTQSRASTKISLGKLGRTHVMEVNDLNLGTLWTPFHINSGKTSEIGARIRIRGLYVAIYVVLGYMLHTRRLDYPEPHKFNHIRPLPCTQSCFGCRWDPA